MSRRARRRMALAAGAGQGDDVKSGGVSKKLFSLVAALGLMVLLAGFGLYFWLKSYLHSDEFRILMSEKVGVVIGAEAHFELFEWQGMHARSAGLTAQSDGMIREVHAKGVQGDVSLSGFRRGVWEIQNVRVSRLVAMMDRGLGKEREKDMPDTEMLATGAEEKRTDTSEKPGLLSGLLPERAEFSSLDISSLDMFLHTAGGGNLGVGKAGVDVRAEDVAVKIVREKATGAYDVEMLGGVIHAPWLGSPMKLQSARGKFKRGQLYLTESRFGVYERGLLTLGGELDGARAFFSGILTGIRAGEMVPEDWQKRISGNLNSRFTVKSTQDGTLTRGKLELKKGTLTALPLLDRIAAYANTQRFRQLNLSEARLNYFKQDKRLELSDIVIASEGLVRVVGDLNVEEGRLEGKFRVGITPGTLAHIPGAETKVFLRGEKGMLWAPLRITGTVDNPQEDLSKRMIAAAGERMFELVPETGRTALKFAHETATELPARAVEAGEQILDEGVDAVREGTDIIREGLGGVLDLLPVPSGEEE